MPGKAKRMVYLDNASTTFPKPECVYAETMEQFRRLGVSPSRGCYSAARQMNEIVQSARLSLAELFAQFARYYRTESRVEVDPGVGNRYPPGSEKGND